MPMKNKNNSFFIQKLESNMNRKIKIILKRIIIIFKAANYTALNKMKVLNHLIVQKKIISQTFNYRKKMKEESKPRTKIDK